MSASPVAQAGRHQKRKCGAMAEAGFYPDPSTMHLHNALYDSQAQSRASLLPGDRTIHLLEFLENLRLICFVHAWSRVSDGKYVGIPFRLHFDPDLSLIGEFDRVTNKIEQGLSEPAFVSPRRRQTRRNSNSQTQVLFGGEGFDGGVNPINQFLHRIVG
jgi:hypothetical protein